MVFVSSFVSHIIDFENKYKAKVLLIYWMKSSILDEFKGKINYSCLMGFAVLYMCINIYVFLG